MKNISFTTLIVLTLMFLLSGKNVNASEGSVQMRSTVGEDTRCEASSHLMQDRNYKVLVTCRDLIYPASDEVITYIVWATPVAGGNPVKLGPLEFGRKELRTNTPFSSLYVTQETQVGRSPEGPVVLRGQVTPFTFLERPSTPTPTPEEDQVDENGDAQNEEEQEPQTTRQKLVAAFKRAGLAAGLALVALIGLIFIVTRSRG